MKLASRHRKEQGFTIIELLVSLTLLAILTGAAVLYTVHHRKAAMASVVNMDVSNLAIFISQNSDNFPEGHTYTQNDSTPANQGFAGFKSSKGVVLEAEGAPMCIQGYNDSDTSPGRKDTAWHINLSEKIITKGLCPSS